MVSIEESQIYVKVIILSQKCSNILWKTLFVKLDLKFAKDLNFRIISFFKSKFTLLKFVLNLNLSAHLWEI